MSSKNMLHHIGTSGWHYPHWRGCFYPETLSPGDWLAYYASHFGTVEINSTFYRLPSAEAVESWARSVPGDFVFAVKASRYITHVKRLKDTGEALDIFFHRVALLGQRLGPVLFQLPPRWHCNPGRLENFLSLLPGGLRYAFEFRDTSWHCDEIYEMLRRKNAAWCIYDLAGHTGPRIVTADFTYLRLHGPDVQPYTGRYNAMQLTRWVGEIRSWHDVRDAYVYFDNDQAGFAVVNALELARRIGSSVARKSG
jgi:uncharacterized protein YecE (DUF72 family)